MRYLCGFGDSEGAPHRTNSKSTLWDLSVVFTHVVDSAQDWELVESELFHVCQFTHSKWSGTCSAAVAGPLRSFENSIQFLLNHYNCTHACLIFWNAPHDRAVLTHSKFSMPVFTLDLMGLVGKSKLGGPHSALGDVQVMLKHAKTARDIIKETDQVPLSLTDTKRKNEAKSRCSRSSSGVAKQKKQATTRDVTVDDLTSSFTELAIAFGKKS